MEAAFALSVFALARSAGAVARMPVLGVLGGPLGFALLGAAALSIAARATAGRWPVPAPPPWALFAVAMVAYAQAGLHYGSRLQPTGDEPHYLLMAQSLWREGDLDLQDNLAREDWREYTPGPLRPHYGAPRADGRPFPGHGPGLPVLLAPVYAMGGRQACVVLLALMGAWVTVLAHAWARRLGASREAALVAWLVAAGPPLLFYAFHVYTEAPSALALFGALWLLGGTGRPAEAVAAAALATCLPFLHHKMIPAAAVVGAVGLLRLRGASRLAFVGVGLAGVAAFLGFYQHVFGRPTPMASYLAFPGEVAAAPGRALAGLLLDRSFGLLTHAPVYVLALAAAAGWRRLSGRQGWPIVAAALAVLAPVLLWRMWWGGQCPPARFLVPALPALAVAAALRIDEDRRGLARWAWPLAAVGLALAVFAIAVPSDLLLVTRAGRPDRLWAALGGAAPLARYLPSLTLLPDAGEWRVAALWTGALALTLGLDRLARRSGVADAAFRGIIFPVGLALTVGALVDGWARAG